MATALNPGDRVKVNTVNTPMDGPNPNAGRLGTVQEVLPTMGPSIWSQIARVLLDGDGSPTDIPFPQLDKV